MTFTYWLPDEQGQKQEYTTSNNSVIIIGANGSARAISAHGLSNKILRMFIELAHNGI